MLRTAALRGHPQAQAFIPELALPPGKPLPRKLSPPLDGIPRDWLEQVFRATSKVQPDR
jgi:hypothetical protein